MIMPYRRLCILLVRIVAQKANVAPIAFVAQIAFIAQIAIVAQMAIVAPCALAGDIDNAPRVQSPRFDVTYSVNESAAPLQEVELWYRTSGKGEWMLFGYDDDLVSPIEYVADEEGLHELFFVITNAAGKSGPEPQPETVPHFSVFVDYTEPIMQLQLARVYENAKGERVVRFEWSAMDLHLSARPVQITYSREGVNDWKIAMAQLPNTGLYEWVVPDELTGNIRFRVSITDRGGNVSAVESDAVRLNHALNGPTSTAPAVNAQNAPPVEEINVPGAHLSASQQHQLNQLIKQGQALGKNRDHLSAIEQYRKALAIEPHHPEALANLGQSLLALGRYEESAKAFQSALDNAPKNPTALFGLAETLINDKQFDAAESRLLDLVASGRHDATTWLRLGDVAAYKGKDFAAHDFYLKVLKSPTTGNASFDPIAMAKARLDEMAVKRETQPDQVKRADE